MPNHLHGILLIVEDESITTVGARHEESIQTGAGVVGARQEDSILSRGSDLASPLQVPPKQNTPRLVPGSLGAIIGAYKSTTARLINRLRQTPGAPLWQRNYFEHIIRNENEWENIRAYVRNNPMQWELDNENPAQNQNPG